MKIDQIKGGVFQSFYANRQSYKENLNYPQTNDLKEDKFQKENKKENLKTIAITLAGAIAPVVALNLAKGKSKGLNKVLKDGVLTLKDKAKATYKLFEIEDFSGILASSFGAILTGGIVGIKNDPKNKDAKIKEGVFELLNNITPTCFVAMGEYYSKKTGKLKSAPAKAALIAGSVVGGMFIANKTSNKLNEKVFDKNKETKTKRPFKLKDCLVHIDDVLTLMVLAKVPFAKTIQADKILPILYAKTGYETATAKENNS